MATALAARLARAERVVVVCGAGASTAGGVSDFKTLYAAEPAMLRALHATTFRRHTDELARFLVLFARRPRPTGVHAFLGRLHAAGQLRHCYTMNLDRLEESALPPTKVTYLHGHRDDDARCGRRTVPAETLWRSVGRRGGLAAHKAAHGCDLRPGFVMYGEPIRGVEGLRRDCAAADLILVIGTRLKTEPVHSILVEHRHKIVGINDEPIAGVSKQTLLGRCEAVCDALCR